MTRKLQFADWVPFPVTRVFAFFSNPENLPRLMPPQTQTRIDRLQLIAPPLWPADDAPSNRRAAGLGSTITTSFRPFKFLPMRRKWTAAITEFEWNHHFADVQQRGPFKRWHHRHEFLEDDRNGFQGTLVHDVIEYEVGFGPLGALANILFVQRRITQTFAHRQKMLPKMFAEGVRSSTA